MGQNDGFGGLFIGAISMDAIWAPLKFCQLSARMVNRSGEQFDLTNQRARIQEIQPIKRLALKFSNLETLRKDFASLRIMYCSYIAILMFLPKFLDICSKIRRENNFPT